MGYYDLTKLSTIDLKRLAAGCVSAALDNPSYRIPNKSVIPQELSSKRFSFRIGKMYFDIILNGDGTMSLYSVSKDGGLSILIE